MHYLAVFAIFRAPLVSEEQSFPSPLIIAMTVPFLTNMPTYENNMRNSW